MPSQLGMWLKNISYPMRDGVPFNSNEGTWYLDPDRHIAEFVITLVGCCAVFALTKPTSRVAMRARDRGRSLVDWLVASALISSWLVMLYAKLTSGLPRDPDSWERGWFMFMPCHMLTGIMAYIMLARGPVAQVLFDVVLYYMMFPAMGLASPDTRDYKYQFEVMFYWVEHYSMVVVPFVLLIEGRFDMHRFCGSLYVRDAALRVHSLSWAWACAIATMFFFQVQVPLSLIRGLNMNFMMAPPDKDVFLVMGPWYRVGFSLACFVMAAASRLGFSLITRPLLAIQALIYNTGAVAKPKQQ